MTAMKRLIAFLSLAALAFAQPAYAQSILRDAETEALFADMSRPLIVAAGLSPRTVKIVLHQDDSDQRLRRGRADRLRPFRTARRRRQRQ